MEKLGRGLVAVRTSDNQVFLSWRLLATDPADISFNLYRGATKLNETPVSGATNYTDNTSVNANYTVRPVINGQEEPSAVEAALWTEPFRRLPLQRPAGGTSPDGVTYTYSPNDLSVGDLDNDGEYEIIVKWNPSNAKDNSQKGYTGNVYLDAYKMNGTRLWRIDLGKNIRAGAHYTQFIVYDLDSDGKAEVAMKTADGTKDGMGVVIGDASADHRNSGGYILAGPEYLTVFNGETGAAMATTAYLPARGNVCDWGDCYGNRVDRFLAGVGYFDGQRPSLVMSRGYYTRTVIATWDWRGGQLTQRWVFDSNTPGNEAYAGQGNHSLSINDVDGDGKDEIVFGSMALDDNGTGLYTTTLGHGDAQHVGDLDPDRPGLESWSAQEDVSAYQGNGLWMRDAGTGEKLWGVPSSRDVGRGMTADLDPNYKGYEAWGADGGLYTVKGVQITTNKPSMNMASWWDGDLQRELLDGTVIDKWNYNTFASERLLSAHDYGAVRNNGSKSNPGLSADILGDWREEVIYSNGNNTELLIFTTTIPTTHKFYTLMHDPQYRVAIAWQNVGYNQPPHTSFYLGEGMVAPPTPNLTLIGEVSTKSSIDLGAIGGNAEVAMSWAFTNLTPAGQELLRDTDTDPAGSTSIASLSTTDRSYVDKTAGNGTTYYYWIKATDSQGNIVYSNAASATPSADNLKGIYVITARHSGKALDVADLSMQNGGNVIQTTTNGEASQQWQITSRGDGVFSITNVNSKKAMDVNARSAADGANIIQWDYTGGTNQQWLISSIGDGYYTIISKNSGKSIEVANSSKENGANVQQWSYTGAANQQFKITPATDIVLGFDKEQQVILNSSKHYPNPFTGNIVLEMEGRFMYSMHDQLGREVEQGSAVNRTTAGRKLIPGLYILHVKANGVQKQYKVVKR